MEESGSLPSDEDAGEEQRGAAFALEILAYLVASRGEELADVLASSKGDFPLRSWQLFDEENQAVRILYDKESAAIQHASRVKEAMETLDSVEQAVSKHLEPWHSQNRTNRDMWDQRAQFIDRRSVKNRRYLEADEVQKDSRALKS